MDKENKNAIYNTGKSIYQKKQEMKTLSVGAKQPTHNESRIHPRVWLLLLGFTDSCLQIWQ